MGKVAVTTSHSLTAEEQKRLEEAAKRVIPAHHEIEVNTVPVRSKP